MTSNNLAKENSSHHIRNRKRDDYNGFLHNVSHGYLTNCDTTRLTNVEVHGDTRSSSRNRKSSYAFGALFRASPPTLAPHKLAQIGGYIPSARSIDSRPSHPNSIVNNTGKIKVILCVQRQFSQISDTHNKDHNSGSLTPNCNSSTNYSSPNQFSSKYDGSHTSETLNQCISVDSRHNQITLIDRNPLRRRSGTPTSKQFAFDAVLTQEVPMAQLCSLAVTDTIQAVLRGQDGCILTIGHKRTGKTYTMIGSDQSADSIGIIPCTISWLFQMLTRQRDTEGTRFSVRISAVEIFGENEKFRDLLAGTGSSSSNDDSTEGCTPSQQLTTTVSDAFPTAGERTKASGESVACHIISELAKRSEIRASSAEKAAQLLDMALSNRAGTKDGKNWRSGLSHMLFTLHVYQCHLEHTQQGRTVIGGRTRLHLLDLGCGRYSHHCGRTMTSIETRTASRSRTTQSLKKSSNSNASFIDNGQPVASKCLSLSAMANVLLALVTGQRHLPFRDSALTYMLREAISGKQVHPCIIAHVSSSKQHYTETLQVVQLAAKLSRLRRRRVGISGNLTAMAEHKTPHHNEYAGLEDTASLSVDGALTHKPGRANRRRYQGPRLGRSSYGYSTSSLVSELDFTSGSEQSCGTVIYLGNDSILTGSNRLQEAARKYRLSQLGLRGRTDGSGKRSHFQLLSDDVSQFQHEEDSEQESPTAAVLFDNVSHSAIGPVKRMMPRTNATVWPRSLITRGIKETLNSHTETWVDGPKAMIALCSPVKDTAACPTFSQGDKECGLSDVEQNGCMCTTCSALLENSSSKTFEFQGPVIANNEQTSSDSRTHGEDPGNFPIVKPVEESFALLTKYLLPWKNTDGNMMRCQPLSPQKLCFSTGDGEDVFADLNITELMCREVSDSPTLEHESRKFPRALSDISECTEEPEMLTDCLTQRNSTPQCRTRSGQSIQFARSSLVEPESQTKISLKIMELKKQICDATYQDKACGNANSNFISKNIQANFRDHEYMQDSCASKNMFATISASTLPLPINAKSTQAPNLIPYVSTESDNENSVDVSRKANSLSRRDRQNRLSANHHADKPYAKTTDVDIISENASPRRDCKNEFESGKSKEINGQQVKSSGTNPHYATASGGDSLLRVAAWVNSIEFSEVDGPIHGSTKASVTHAPDNSPIRRNRIKSSDHGFGDSLRTSQSIVPFSNCTDCIPNGARALKSLQSNTQRLEESLQAAQNKHMYAQYSNRCDGQRLSTRSQTVEMGVGKKSTRILPESAGAYPSFQPNHSDSFCRLNQGLLHNSLTVSPISNSFTPGDIKHPEARQVDETFQDSYDYPLLSPFFPKPERVSPQADISVPTGLTDKTLGETRYRGQHWTIPAQNDSHTTRKLRRSCSTSSAAESKACTTHPNGEVTEGKRGNFLKRLLFATLPTFRGFRKRDREEKDKTQSKTASTNHSPLPISSPSDNLPLTNDRRQVLQTASIGQKLIPIEMHPKTREQWRQSTVERQQSIQWPNSLVSPRVNSESRHEGGRQTQNMELGLSTILRGHSHMKDNVCEAQCKAGCTLHKEVDIPKTPYQPAKIEQYPTDINSSNNFSTPIVNFSYGGGGQPAPVYRSGRRSALGGAASSGYESMRIGASDLSLSHPDSASDCSGFAQPSYLWNNATKCSFCKESQHGQHIPQAGRSFTLGSKAYEPISTNADSSVSTRVVEYRTNHYSTSQGRQLRENI